MSKRRAVININLNKIDKSLLYQGKKGLYLDAVVWLDDKDDQYGNNTSVKQDTNRKDVVTAYIGNGKHNLDGISKDDTTTDIPF